MFGLYGTGRVRSLRPTVHLANLPPKEIELLSRPEFAGFTTSYSEMYRAGSRGPYWDAVAFARPWGFRLQDVRPTRYPGEGHFIFYSRAAEILATLADEKSI